MASKCKKKGGTLAEASKAIFACVEPGKTNNWFTYECFCGKWHVCTEPKTKL